MNLRIRREGDGVVARLTGGRTLEYADAERIKDELAQAFSGSRRRVVDLSEVEFLDSAGVGVLVSVFKNARASGASAAFAGLQPSVRAVLALIRLDSLFDVYPDAESALAGGAPPAAP